MCGIAGIIAKNPNPDFEGVIKSMMSVLKHRGPDGGGFFIDKANGVFLGHRRLSIIDLSDKASQPMFNENKQLALVFNGEIYNYVELRDALLKKGHQFISSTDSEVLLHGWEEWNWGLLDRINGMYAFCIYDRAKKELLLVRDNIGIKPLYYIDKPELFAFASESRAFYSLGKNLWGPELNEDMLRQMLVFQYVVDTEKTIYSDVKKLKPGHYLHYKEGRFEVKPYWTLIANDLLTGISFEEAINRCDEQLKKTVAHQLRSDVPVGVMLSGGLDSSLIAAIAKKHSNKVRTFTATFGHKLDEGMYANRCAQYLGTEHTELQIDPLSINDKIEQIIRSYDDLSTFDGSIFTIYLMAEKIRKFGIKVLLVGEGADEVFGGYSWFGLSQFPFRFMPSVLRSSIYHYAISRQFSGHDSFRHTSYLNNIIKSFGESDIFRQVSRFEITHQLPNHFLMKVDRGTMAHSLEARVPYLDKDLVELVFSLKAAYKLKGRTFNFSKTNEKYVQREVAKRYLPQDIYSRKKRGFSIPMELVLKSNMAKVRDYVLNPQALSRGYFSKKQLEGLFNFKNVLYSPIHKQKEFILWRLFLLEVWKKTIQGEVA